MEASTLTLPRRQQTMEALAKANRRRNDHIGLKRDLAAGRVRAADALADPRAAGSFTIGTLLTAQRGWGELTALEFLKTIGAPPTVMMKQVDSLTGRQRGILTAALRQPFAPVEGEDRWL